MKKAEKEIKEEVAQINKVEETTTEKVEEKAEPKAKKETVEIAKSDYDKLMAQLERNAKDINLLYQAADKTRLAKVIDTGSENLIKQAKISFWDGGNDIIVGWSLVSNKCEVVQGRWIEDQQAVVVLENGDTVTVPLLEFYRKTLKKESGDIISKTEKIDSRGNKILMYNIQFPNGKLLEINSVFVN